MPKSCFDMICRRRFWLKTSISPNSKAPQTLSLSHQSSRGFEIAFGIELFALNLTDSGFRVCFCVSGIPQQPEPAQISKKHGESALVAHPSQGRRGLRFKGLGCRVLG